MASEIEFVNYKQFVENLPARTSAKSGDKSIVSNSTDGPGSETNAFQAQKVLAGNVAEEFDPTRDEDHSYFAGESVVYEGVTYTFVVDHYGAWDAGKVVGGLNFQENKGLKKKNASSAGFRIWGTEFSVSSRTWGLNKRIKGYVTRVSSTLKANSSIDVLAIVAGSLKKVKIGTLVNSGATIKYVSVDVNAFIDGYIGLHESSGTSVVPYVTRNDGECNSFVIVDSTPTIFEANANWAPVLDVEYNDAEEYGAEDEVVENIVSGTASVNLGLSQAFTNRAVCLPNPITGLVKNLSVYVVAGKSLFVCVCNGKSVKPYVYASNSDASNKWMNFDCHIVMNEGDYIGILGADGYAAYAQRNNVNGGAKFFVSDGTTSDSSVWTIGLSVTVESDVNEIISNLPKNIVVPFYGQSLSVGADASPELKSADLKNAVSLNGKVIVSSVSASDIVKYEFTKLSENIVETPATGCALGVIESLSERFGIPKNPDVWKSVNFYFVSCGQGSTSLEALADSDGALYQGLINAVSRIVDLIEADGKEAFIPALVWIQGETNMRYGVESPAYYADSYASKLSTLVSSLNTAFKSMTGQTADIKCICYQTASQGYINGQYFQLDWNFTNIPKLSKVPMQQMLAVRDYDNFVASVPVYAITHNEDVTDKANIHLTNDGSRHLGYYCGRALASVLLGDGMKCGILPVSYKVSGNDILIKFSIEEGTLTTDTSFVRKVENFGFSVFTSGNVELISSIEVYSDEVVIHCSTSPVGALLSYACIGENGYDGRTKGARGNLCSTSEKFVQIVNKKVVQKDFCFAFYCVLADGLNDIE